ncbi:MAG TPA: hypothetical protein PLS53_09175 [Thermoanaerobaculaceae bacterium]|nr:hypothetical protein [Thermoanaerobaculaceae bacterium]HPS78315.1 hypothetical protein [Thermoanaerobaculaceae bacterium]
MRRLFVLKVALGIVAVATVGMVACGNKGVTREVRVAGYSAWTDTGLDVQAQQRLTVDASGEVAANPENKTSPDGFSAKPEWRKYNVVPDVPHMALIAKIGESGKGFLVGAAFRGPAPISGRLFLGVNDRDTRNNKGSFNAVVTVK